MSAVCQLVMTPKGPSVFDAFVTNDAALVRRWAYEVVSEFNQRSALHAEEKPESVDPPKA